MSGKDQFKSSKARHTGQDTNEQNKELINELRVRSEEADQEPRNHTLRLTPVLLEKIKDYVYHQKLNGQPFYSQGELVEQAVWEFFERLDHVVPERPDEVKKKEKRRTGRKKRSSTSGSTDSLFF
ncbi:MAG: hypothetical protein ABJN36_11405 [Cyclobacteriaceae bacterium]